MCCRPSPSHWKTAWSDPWSTISTSRSSASRPRRRTPRSTRRAQASIPSWGSRAAGASSASAPYPRARWRVHATVCTAHGRRIARSAPCSSPCTPLLAPGAALSCPGAYLGGCCTHACMLACMHVQIHGHLHHTCMHAHVHERKHTGTRARVHACEHMLAQTRTHARMLVHTHISAYPEAPKHARCVLGGGCRPGPLQHDSCLETSLHPGRSSGFTAMDDKSQKNEQVKDR